MRRRWKVATGVVVAIGLLLGLNAIVTQRESRAAEVTVPDGRLMQLTGGELQVVDRGPRQAPPIVLIHCFTCAIDWWDRVLPALSRRHRVVAIDMLGHGGSEKPSSGYSISNQADVIAEALGRLGVRRAEVVGHSLGGTVAVALAERSPALVDRVIVIGTTASREDEGDLGLLAGLALTPVVGDALWRIKPDASVREGLEVAFAPGFEVPDAFVEDVNRMTYPAFDESSSESERYTRDRSLAARMAATGKPLMVLMGAEEQIVDDPPAALRVFAEGVPNARTVLMPGVGHSPNVEAPARTVALIEGFAAKSPANQADREARVQRSLQNRGNVRGRP